MVRVELAEPPAGRKTIPGFSFEESPVGEVEIRDTFPVKAPMLVSVIVEATEEPATTLTLLGLAVITKSEADMTNVAVTLWCKLPLVPVTVTPQVPPVCGKLVKVSVEIALPFVGRLTTPGLMVQVGQPMARHCTGSVRVTVPLNPLRLVRLIAEVAVDPGATIWEAGFAPILKSGPVLGDCPWETMEIEEKPIVPSKSRRKPNETVFFFKFYTCVFELTEAISVLLSLATFRPQASRVAQPAVLSGQLLQWDWLYLSVNSGNIENSIADG